jgi:hypothetical protein
MPAKSSIAAAGARLQPGCRGGRVLRKGLDASSFPHIAERAQHLSALTMPLAAEQAVELLCSDCPFYHPDREEQLECGSFLILKRLLERGVLTPAQIVAARR